MRTSSLNADEGRPIDAPVIADADGDIAALVYGAQDRPDLLLRDFAHGLRKDGYKLCGLVQFRGHDTDGRRRLLVLDRGRSFDVHRAPGAPYHIDAPWLDRMAERVKAGIANGVDLAVASRFGPLERAGRGFHGVIKLASETRTPLIVVVPQADFDRWTWFSAGMTVRLECRPDSVSAWWRGLATAAPRAGRSRACEILK
ncbi:DUF2478 domain-containing protein [Xanthobacteraceae bacterium Astr-EGSB]|uniref:DUF2478 domain-containing protein n=1 Tax=Astrobacterium formosum TaxID=3069710 RepID=UPI0027AE0305|nr:DUF2478 domain-containing protein [Xanthobacteraceae bacterium Astr-EGSB]